MIDLNAYINRFTSLFGPLALELPWQLTANIRQILQDKMGSLGSDYNFVDDVAIHRTVSLDSHAIVKGPAIIGANCFIGAHAYIRGGVFLDEKVSLGPGCEVKSSFIFSNSALGHFNFVGDSILGSYVNMEAGSVIANHYNERNDKTISVYLNGGSHLTGMEKFGAVVGDGTKIGANAVLSPGTLLKPGSIVRRLELVEQGRQSSQ